MDQEPCVFQYASAVNTAVSRAMRQRPAPTKGRCFPLLCPSGDELDRAVLQLHAVQEMKDFWTAACAVLHAALPVHFICMCLRPFALMPSTIFRERAPFASEDEFRRFQELSPIAAFLSVRPGALVVRMSDIIADPELKRSEFYRRFMLPCGDRYFACLNFWHSGHFQGLIGLHRTGDQRDFTHADMVLMAQLHPHFDTVLHRILNLNRERAVRLSLEKLLVDLPMPTALLDWDLRVAWHNRSAIEACAAWNLGPERAAKEKRRSEIHIPGPLTAFCANFKVTWNPCLHRLCSLTSPQGVYFSPESQPGLRALINLLQLDAAPLSMPMFLIRFEDNRPVFCSGNGENARTAGLLSRLSPRERDVAWLVGQGLSNDEVALHLSKSILTVKRQLRSIYQKLNIAGRGRLTAMLR